MTTMIRMPTAPNGKAKQTVPVPAAVQPAAPAPSVTSRYELQAETEAGRRLVALAEEISADLGTRA